MQSSEQYVSETKKEQLHCNGNRRRPQGWDVGQGRQEAERRVRQADGETAAEGVYNPNAENQFAGCEFEILKEHCPLRF